MSSQSTANPPSISRNAAKKRAKRAAATARSTQPPVTATATAEVRVDLGDAVDPNDPDNLYLPPGEYPSGGVDLEYEQFFDDTEFPPGAHNGHAHHQQSFPLPFLDYTLSPYNQHPHPFANLPPSVNITNEDLIQTANELYRRMADPKFASDDAYWTSLPPHIRNFIREAVPFGDPQVNGGGRDQSIHSLAQRIVSVASQGMGLQGMGANLLNGVGMPPPRSGQAPPTQAGLASQLGFHSHPDARDDDEYEDEDQDQEVEPGHAAANGDAPKKKNKKKKKKAANTTVADVPLTPSSLPPVPPIKQPPQSTPQPHHQQQQAPQAARPVLNPPPPPATNAPATPLQSSRALGKQPMAATPAANQPSRSARSAGKQAASSQQAPAQPHSHPPAKTANGKGKAPANAPPAKIWAQSSVQDRENIRAFWLGLSNAERRDLLQIEKDSVIKKMKESHRTACGCAVCGRKKVNIETELGHLYDKYYEELVDYAADQQNATLGRHPGPPGAGPFPGSVEVDATGQVTRFDHRAPDRLPPEEYDDEGSDVYEEDEYDDDEEDLEDDQSDEADAGDELEDPQQPVARQPRKAPSVKAPAPRPEGAEDFVTFGTDSSLRHIKGGILTVADDLLKNDGTKFLDMMERLAIARSAREEQNIRDMQNDTEDDDFEKEDPVTEAEHIEEGNRMFQIFAARLFEQRVLQAFRERVSKQREDALLSELDQEKAMAKAKEEKKAKEAQKKKDKKRLQKQRADEEKAAREAALAEEQRVAKEKAAELERERQKKAEEERARREAVKKAAAEEAARKEAERKKRQQEEREREEEAKRKRLEAQEKARKEKEAREKEAKEKERKEREEKAAKEKAEKDRLAKEKAEKDRLAKEKAEKERQAKLEEEREREKARKEQEARKSAAAAEHARQQAEEQTKQQRAREAKEHAAFERAAAAESSAATGRLSASAEKNRATPPNLARPPSVPQSASIPINQPSPIKAAPASSSSMHRGQTGPFPSSVGSAPKTQAPAFLSQPGPGMPYGGPRVPPIGQNLAPGYRQGYPSQSPVFSPPANGVPSPVPPTGRSFPEPSPPGFEHMRSAPIGMGFPPPKGGNGRPAPIGTMDEFSPPPIGARALSSANTSSDLPTQLNALSLMNDSSGSVSGSSQQPPPPFGMSPASAPAPIGPPKAAPQPIGRPAFHETAAPLHVPSSLASASSLKSPAGPEQVLGSAALGSDDDVVVQPARRNTSNGWDVPPAGAGGLGGGGGASRWSTAPSIWGGASAAPSAPLSQTAQIVNDNADSSLNSGNRVLSHWSRAPFSAGAGPGQPRQGSLSGGLGGVPGPFGAAPGSNPFGQGVNPFSAPPLGGQQQQQQQQQQSHSQQHHH